ncbi:MAG: hypothetical protein QN120_02975 [Armatimonadota bacterium]|nr:hypothetical protein [Armatimonadota bacterium]
MRRAGGSALLALLCVVASAGQVGGIGLAAQPGPVLALTGVSHSLDGQVLVVSGSVENRGQAPVAQLVIDATGYTSAGEAAFFGSDGVPWSIPPGGVEPFSINLPLRRQLIRDYQVRVALASAPGRPLASVRRGVDVSLYHPLLISVVRLRGTVLGGTLIVRSDVGGWPVAEVTAEALLVVPGRRTNRLQTLVIDVPADRERRIDIGIAGAELVSLRAVDVRLTTTWAP